VSAPFRTGDARSISEKRGDVFRSGAHYFRVAALIVRRPRIFSLAFVVERWCDMIRLEIRID